MQDRWNGIGSFSVHRRRLAFERMEERRLLSVGPLAPDATFASVSSDLASLTGTVDGYPVSIDRHDAPAQSIDELERAWLVIHGNASAPTASYINVLADALHSASSGDQVLTLDWSTIAALAIGTTENYIIRVAEWASSTLTSYGFSGGLLNLVGHSFGAYVAGEMAERIPGGVNTIVGLDPAENWPFGYNPESSGQIDFAGFSAFSWTFSDAGGFYGSEVTPGSAHEAVTVENTDHSGPVRLFSNMLKGVGSADVLHYLPISRLLDHTAGPWAPNQYDHSGNPTASGAFEAVITADAAGDAALSIDFVALASDDPPTADAGGPYLVDEGSTITLDASGSTDPENDITLYAWDLDGDGLFGETGSGAARGDELGVYPVFTAVGLDGPASLLVSLRVVDDDGARDQDAATVRITEPLGAVDFLELSGLDPSLGDLWYSLETTREGFLTIVSPNLDGTITLYDENFNPLLPGASQRVDSQVGDGETYYFKLSGAGSSVDLRLANLVSQVDTNVAAYGTDGEDLFEFDASASRLVTVNGVSYHFSDAEATFITFDGRAAADSAVLYGNNQNETAELWPGHGTLDGEGYRVTISDVETVVAAGGGGIDVALLHGTAGAQDTLIGDPNVATLSGDGYSTEVTSFRYVHVYGTSGDGDEAVLRGDPNARDTFEARPGDARLYGDSFLLRAKWFDDVRADGTPGGDDVALLHDDPESVDTFVGGPDQAELSGDAFFLQANSFRYVHAYATVGSGDVATFHDDPARFDKVRAWPGEAKLWGGLFFLHAKSFQYIYANSTPGVGDQALLYDSTTDDTFTAWPDRAEFSVDTFFTQVNSFRWVHAYSTEGDDVATLYGSDDRDVFVGTNRFGKLRGADYYNRAVSFGQLHVYGGAGRDVATLYDAVLEEGVAQPVDVTQVAWLYEFERIRQRSDSGETVTDVVDQIFTAYWQ